MDNYTIYILFFHRFWGKIFGIRKNYYIVEAKVCNKISETADVDHPETLATTNIDGTKVMKDENPKPDGSNDEMSEIDAKNNEVPVDEYLVPRRPKITESDETDYATVYPPMPKLHAVLPKSMPTDVEKRLNSKVYYVCSDLNDEWIEIPSVTEQQIDISRKITKYLTGNLETEIKSVPLFPGREKHYLRAIIARISAATHIAPVGVYKPGSANDSINVADHKSEHFDKILLNPNYRPAKINNRLNLNHWVHIAQRIPDASVLVIEEVRPTLEPEDDQNENLSSTEEGKNATPNAKNATPDAKNATLDAKRGNGKAVETKERKSVQNNDKAQKGKQNAEPEQPTIVEPEKDLELENKVPEILIPCSSDLYEGSLKPWTISFTGNVSFLRDMVTIKSNTWPGAYAFSCGTVNDYIYIGWGIKRSGRKCILSSVKFENECIELEEMMDPTLSEEKVSSFPIIYSAFIKISKKYTLLEIGT